MRFTETQADLFWSKVSIPPNVETDCWLWTAAHKRGNYGCLRLNGVGVAAHRAAYSMFFGDIPDAPGRHRVSVRHSCDNPTCVNPKHLLLGSHADNMRDRAVRGRYFKKLSFEQVAAIKADTRSQSKIAATFGINQSQVSRIKRGQACKYEASL